ncbi:hypothetical protein CEXT_410201 [Caerostris extrusa]|uniref:Ribosomal protein S17 n=1 Tax=Caerostris extrusa TaxID=172846 RepID=A0AAV4TKA2_CAEEX|nr:hypothetical protein CEXT_410201 [Caerostris extrusa]
MEKGGKNSAATVPRRMKKCLVIPGLVHSGNSVCNRIKEVVYSGFDFPSELEVKKKEKREVRFKIQKAGTVKRQVMGIKCGSKEEVIVMQF